MRLGRLLIGIFFLLILILPTRNVLAYDYDLGFSNKDDIWFSKDSLIIGDTVRIYARVTNFGVKDSTASVTFYQGTMLLQESQPVSLVANGVSDEVFIDVVVPQTQFNIFARINGTYPSDQNSSNNEVVTGMFFPVNDRDHDVIPDDVDSDDDNDGLSDNDEANQNTDPLKPDSDGDGVNDNEDQLPLDSSKTEKDLPKIETKTETLVAKPKTVIVFDTEEETSKTALEARAGENFESLESAVALEEVSSPAVAPDESLTLHIYSEKIHWNTYRFSSNFSGEKYIYDWNFGDNSTASIASVEHTYSKTGSYVVTLTVTDSRGVSVSQTYQMYIGALHIDNPLIWGLLVALGVIIVLALFFLWYLQKRKKHPKKVDDSVTMRDDVSKDNVATENQEAIKQPEEQPLKKKKKFWKKEKKEVLPEKPKKSDEKQLLDELEKDKEMSWFLEDDEK